MSASSTDGQIVGVDVGGTFTDFFLFDPATGNYKVEKIPSTPTDQSTGFLSGLQSLHPAISELATVVHGTTVGTNALLQRRGARTGLITTRGFRDVLEMRRRDRPTTWGLWGHYEPIISRDLRLEIDERTLADGHIDTPVDLDQLQAAAEQLLAAGAEALCLVFINAYANPHNERVAYAVLQRIWPNQYIAVSSEILPEIREFERTSTTALNAYLQPPVGHYLQRLATRLSEAGFTGQTLIVQSNGGVMTLAQAAHLPVRTALSGPAAGVIASAYIATEAGFNNVITCDMGGTSFDVAVIKDGVSTLAAQTSIDFGLVIRTPMIEMTTIGAGGGSIAHIDRGGLLQIGPQSAGSDPGPVCYGLGNDQPTVTDANLVLGRINPDKPIGGKLSQLDIAAARQSIDQHIGQPLALDTLAAAEAIVKVADSRMAGAVRLVSVERGHDPKHFVAMPFGGGGALHAGALIRQVGLAGALIPRYPGINSALGCVIADMRHDSVQTLNQALSELDINALNQRIATLADDGRAWLQSAGIRFSATITLTEFDMAYAGQTHAVAVAMVADHPPLDREQIHNAFVARYQQVYGRALDAIAIRVLNLRVAAIGQRAKFDLTTLAPQGGTIAIAHTDTRSVWIDGRFHPTAIYDRLQLPVAARIAGPALLEQADATVFIEPGMSASVDRFGNLLIQPDPH